MGNISNTIASTATAGSALVTIGGSAFALNIKITSGTPTGTIVAKQFNTPGEDVSAIPAFITIPVKNGKFLNGTATFKLSSGSTQPLPTLGIYWTPTGTPAGAIAIQGKWS